MPFIGFILIGMALFSVGGVLYMVLREHDEPEEWYIPPSPSDKTPTAIDAASERQAEDSGE